MSRQRVRRVRTLPDTPDRVTAPHGDETRVTVRALLRCAAAAAMMACTDPTAVGPEPQYLGPGPERFVIRDTTFMRALPQDSCPPFVANDAAGVRRSIPGSAATMAFPADARVTAVSFDAARGGVFDVRGAGLIAVTYASDFPLFASNRTLGSRDTALVTYVSWCRIAVGGRPAVLHVEQFVVPAGDGRGEGRAVQYFTQDNAVSVHDPAGRRVSIRIVGAERRFLVTRTSPRLAALLAIVASLEW